MSRSSLRRAAALSALVMASATALGAPAFTWPAAPLVTQTVLDPDEGLAKTAREILSAEYAWDGSYHYFRITLKGAPSGVGPNDNWAGNYGIYIDSGPGGWSYLETNYLPYPIQGVDTTGIDIALDGHWNFAGSGPNFPVIGQHYHYADPLNSGAYLYGVLDGFNPQPPASSTNIEFKLAGSQLNLAEGFCWFAGTLDVGSEVGTYDLTQKVCIPEPAAALLALVGGLFLRRRVA